jgi:uncharacterized membrane protein YdbT with pleckstrin-like domain
VIGLWIVLGPFMVGFVFWFGWWSLVLVAGAVWATYDYLKRGDVFGPVARAVSRSGAFLPGAWKRHDRDCGSSP